ncbi:MAG: ribose-phosphate pyrophosphokinase [candidate division Zixibacteria bacterium]|nr:ribose-phosphate pyrophosphokinase [candidate division Zixibacteria bacterium]
MGYLDSVRILCGNSNLPLAKTVSRSMGIPISSSEVGRFSDGEVIVQIKENIRGCDVFIIQSTNPPAENLMELLIMLDAVRRASASRITAVIPYYGYGRQDRKDRPRVAITAKLVANMIIAAGANRVLLMDLHASQIQGYFDIPSDHLYSSRIFNDHFKRNPIPNAVTVTPDVGSVKMARAMAKKLGYGLAIVDKRRSGPNQNEVMNIIGEVKDQNVLIRDDMVDTAGTLVKAAKALVEEGAEEIYACCTHGVFSGDSYEMIQESPIKEIIVSDSIDFGNNSKCNKIKILSMGEMFGEAIKRIAGGESVSSLFD